MNMTIFTIISFKNCRLIKIYCNSKTLYNTIESLYAIFLKRQFAKVIKTTTKKQQKTWHDFAIVCMIKNKSCIAVLNKKLQQTKKKIICCTKIVEKNYVMYLIYNSNVTFPIQYAV